MSTPNLSVPVNDFAVRELHLQFHVSDLIPREYGPIDGSYDWIVIQLMYSDPYSGRPRKREIRIPSTGF